MDLLLKKCNKCNIEKPLNEFYFRKDNNRYRNNCKFCCNKVSKTYQENNKEKLKRYYKEYKEKNKDVLRDKDRKYREKNREKVLAILKNYREKNKNYFKSYSEKYRKKNKEKISKNKKQYKEKHKEKHKEKIREKARLYARNRRKYDLNYRILGTCRARINGALRKNKSARTIELLGCTIEEYRIYLESKFQKNMSWENYGLKGWHIDHIKPCASFDLMEPEQQRKCFHFTNTQPLWAIDNILKGNKIEEET